MMAKLDLFIIAMGILVYFSGYISKRLMKILAVLIGVGLTGFLAFSLFSNSGGLRIGLGHELGIGIYKFTFSVSFINAVFVVLLSFMFAIFLLGAIHEENSPSYYLFAFLTYFGAINSLLAADLLGFFIFFEIMSIFSFFLVLKGREGSEKAALKYIVWSVFGAYLFLAGIFIKAYLTHSFDISTVFVENRLKLLMFVLILMPFVIKAALMPFHLWAPDAYQKSKDTFTVFFSGGLSKIGIYGYILVLFSLMAKTDYQILRTVIMWLGGITALFAGIYAFMEDDAKRMLAYSSISQLGYAATGIALGTPLGFTAGVFHAVGHAIFEGLLFLVVAGVAYRIGTTDLRKMGGLIKKMPLSFIGLLFAIIAASGIPPTIGFPSKWMLYEALLEKGQLLLVSVIFMASITAFLYSFKLVHSIFLGKLHKEHKEVKEVPWGYASGIVLMLIPLLIFGLFPGKLIHFIDYGYRFLTGKFLTGYTTSFIRTSLGYANMLTIGSVMGLMFIISLTIYLLHGKIYKADQTDNYTATEWVDEDFELHYASEFYGFMRKAFGNFLKLSMEKIINAILKLLEFFAEMFRRVYLGDVRVYIFYVILMFALLYWIRR